MKDDVTALLEALRLVELELTHHERGRQGAKEAMRIGKGDGGIAGTLDRKRPETIYLLGWPPMLGIVEFADRQAGVPEKSSEIEPLRAERVGDALQPGR